MTLDTKFNRGRWQDYNVLLPNLPRRQEHGLIASSSIIQQSSKFWVHTEFRFLREFPHRLLRCNVNSSHHRVRHPTHLHHHHTHRQYSSPPPHRLHLQSPPTKDLPSTNLEIHTEHARDVSVGASNTIESRPFDSSTAVPKYSFSPFFLCSRSPYY